MGDRDGCRALVNELSTRMTPVSLVTELFWPVYEAIEKLYRSDALAKLNHHFATRLLRVLVDQNSARLVRTNTLKKSILVLCGPRDADELGAQMAVDLIESIGFRIVFGGGGIPNDEIISYVRDSRPEVLLFFASHGNDLPAIRVLIDTLREVGAQITIAVGAGVFNRVDGLPDEIGADLWAQSPLEMVKVLAEFGHVPPATSSSIR